MAKDYLSELIKETKKQNKDSSEETKKTTKENKSLTKENENIANKNEEQKKKEETPVQKDLEIGSLEDAQIDSKNMSQIELTEEDVARTVKKEDITNQKIESSLMEPKRVVNIEKEVEQLKKTELDSYGEVRIYKIEDRALPFYYTPALRPTNAERRIINTLKEVTTRLISYSPFKIRDLDQRRFAYKQKVLEIIKNSPTLRIPLTRRDFYAGAVVREMVGYGLIDDLIKDDKLEEIMIIGPNKPVYVFHREYEMMTSNIEFINEQEINDLINRIAREVGRRVDTSAPLLDARLADGSRVNATIPPASISGGTLTIRKFREDPFSVIDLIEMGTLTSETAAFLWLCVEGLGIKPANILISGGTGSGKTTLLNVLATFIPERERIITIEDTAELNLPMTHWIRFESRPPGLEGAGELRMDVLTKNALRMRPDRILVGEIRHAEATTLFTALNTGHDGCLGTVHANSPEETLIRVISPPMNVPEIMLSGLDFIVVEHRFHDRKKGTIRRISEIAEVTDSIKEKAETRVIYQRDPIKDTIERTLINSEYISKLSKFTGLTEEKILSELTLRRKFLENLKNKKIRKMDEVSIATKRFLEAKEKMSDKLEKQ